LPINIGPIPLTKLNDVFTIWSALIVSSMAEDRAWMYNGRSRNGRHSDEWITKTKDFVDHAFSLSLTGTMRCPCRWHENSIFLN
jgi:pyocin large subunit-like protein